MGDELWLDCEPGVGAVLAAALNRFRIRVKAEVTDRSHDFGVLEVRGMGALDLASSSFSIPVPVAVPEVQHAHVAWPGRDGVRVVRADWPDGTPGFDVVGPPGADGLGGVLDDLEAIGLHVVGGDTEEYNYRRIAAGVVRQGIDTTEATIPQEAYLERTAVSFTKGCFLGQELVCRIDSFGQVPRLLRLVRLATRGPVEPGAEVVFDGTPVGTVTSVASEPEDGPGALAFASVRRTVALPADVTVAGVAGRLDVLPGRVDDDAPKPVARARLGLRATR